MLAKRNKKKNAFLLDELQYFCEACRNVQSDFLIVLTAKKL